MRVIPLRNESSTSEKCELYYLKWELYPLEMIVLALKKETYPLEMSYTH